MKSRGRMCVWLIFVLFIAGAGYLWWEGAPTEFDDEETTAPPIQAALTPASAAAVNLDLQLKKGDSFPLRKVVTETVTQATADGPIKSRTTLTILLAIHVEEVQPRKTRLRVDYQHVKYHHTLGTEEIHYDSKSNRLTVPPEAQPYRGLVGNGFEFWLGTDHTVIEVIDFQKFLDRCVQHVPAAQRNAVLRRFVIKSGEEPIANFIDDSFGLLPKQGTAVRLGTAWDKHRRVERPIPLDLTGTCSVTELNDRFAKIAIHGKVRTSAPFGQQTSAGKKLQLTVTGGSITGSCRIRRSTGLPEHSDITRILDMTVRLPNGRTVEQQKKTTTVIAVYSSQGSAKALAIPSPKGETNAEPRRLGRLSANERR